VLSVRTEVLYKRPSEGMPGAGIVHNEWLVEGADGTPKMRMESPGFIARRSDADD
jgi:hypothetical protein